MHRLRISAIFVVACPLYSEAFPTPDRQHVKQQMTMGRGRAAVPSSPPAPSTTATNLVPIERAWDESGTDSKFSGLVRQLGCEGFDSGGQITKGDGDAPYTLYIASSEDDLPPIASLTVEVFDSTAITLSTDLSAWEQALVQPLAGAYNSYAFAVGYTEVLSGLRKRMRNRLTTRGDGVDWLAPLIHPETAGSDDSTEMETALEDIAARSSLIFSLSRPNSEGEMESVASIELRLQPTDAKIPFSQPWLDKIERRLARVLPFTMKEEYKPSKGVAPLRPYLCNLCVSPSLRSLGIGRALCRIVEAIARDIWRYNHIYLHVDPTNIAAKTLYENEGYVDVGRRWNAVWSGGAEEISYYVKKLRS